MTRNQKGERNNGARLTAKEVQELRGKYDSGEWTQRELAFIFGISRSQVRRIVNGEHWPQETP